MKRLFAVALALVLAGRVAISLPLIQSPTELTTNRVSLGARVALRVEATIAISRTLSYQWRFGTGDIPGATNAVQPCPPALDGATRCFASPSSSPSTTLAPLDLAAELPPVAFGIDDAGVGPSRRSLHTLSSDVHDRGLRRANDRA